MLDHADHLPGPQRDALGVAFGFRAGDSTDRLLIGLAALSLMSEVAEERRLLCVIDDAQWLDHASAAAIGFVGRRLLAAEPVVVLVGTRGAIDEFARLPEIDVRGLRDGEVAPEQLEAVRADALAGAPWRAELDLPKPSAELNQAISRMFREARTAMETGREPPMDAVILAVRATHVGSPGLDQLVCRALRSAVEQRRNRRPLVGEAVLSTDERPVRPAELPPQNERAC
jgi:hypothetical protein